MGGVEPVGALPARQFAETGAVGGKLLGVWGLILGIPIMNYIFRHAIRFPKDRPTD